MIKKTILEVWKEVISFLEKNELFVDMPLASPSDYVFHNNFNTITIDSLGISLYDDYKNGELDEDGNPLISIEQLDKDLIELIRSYVPDTKHIIIKIERSMDLPKIK